ncbi:MAG: thiamine phosphate synthase [Dehalococcoidia bacterium]|nr:MAG: thiamine phosphate synthase [Dehalococcoidia bacterium]
MTLRVEGGGQPKRIPRLQILTDEVLQTRFTHVELAHLAIEGGADAVQYREKRAITTRELMAVASDILSLCVSTPALLIVDDRVDVTCAVGAHGVHLGRNDLDVTTARTILGAGALIGGTANSYEEAARVWTSGVDYLGVGPIYGTRSKANPAPEMGLDTLRRICADAPVPVVAIGSITAQRIPEVMAAGAYGVAVLSEVLLADDPLAATRRCRAALDVATAVRGR